MRVKQCVVTAYCTTVTQRINDELAKCRSLPADYVTAKRQTALSRHYVFSLEQRVSNEILKAFSKSSQVQ